MDRAVSLVEQMQTRIEDLSHIAPHTRGGVLAAIFALMRGDHRAPARASSNSLALAREHDLPLFRAFGVFLQGWATADRPRARRRARGHALRRRATREQNVLWFDGL